MTVELLRKNMCKFNWFEVRNDSLLAFITRLLYLTIFPLNSKLNSICHLLTLLGAHHIFHVSRIRDKRSKQPTQEKNFFLPIWMLFHWHQFHQTHINWQCLRPHLQAHIHGTC